MDCVASGVGALYFKYMSKNMDWILLAISTAGLIAGISHFFLPESPAFYLSKQKNKQAIDSYRAIAKMNGCSHNIAADDTIFETPVKCESVGVKFLLKHRAVPLVCVVILWCATSFTYYLIYF